MAANWSELSDDILDFLATRIPLDAKQIATFAFVSKSWKSSIIEAKKRTIPTAPYLILQNRDNDHRVIPDSEEGIRSFYCLSTKTVFDFTLPTQERRCWGTPYGWFFTMGLDFKINLFNPLTGSQISLPSQQTLPDKSWLQCKPSDVCEAYVQNFVLTSDPCSWCKETTTPLVVATYGGSRKVAVACPGDESWTPLEGSPVGNEDVLFYKNRLYIVGREGVLRVCDIDTSPLNVTDYASPPLGVYNVNKFYLVEMCGDLHLVVRFFDPISGDENADEDGVEGGGEEEVEEGGEEEEEEEEEKQDDDGDEDNDEDEWELEEDDDLFDFHYETVQFLVFKLDLHTRKWVKLEDLGGHAIFVGNHMPFAIPASSYFEIKGNCIYFTDDHIELYQYRFCDMGVYDIMKKTVTPIYDSNCKNSKFARPSFFMPSAK